MSNDQSTRELLSDNFDNMYNESIKVGVSQRSTP